MVNSKSALQPFPGGISIEIWPLEKLIPYARNPCQIPQIAIDKVARSIREFGFRQPIVVDAAGVIIVGHVRRLAAQTPELTEVPMHVATELTAAQVNAYRLADNRTNQEASWDTEALALEASRDGTRPQKLRCHREALAGLRGEGRASRRRVHVRRA